MRRANWSDGAALGTKTLRASIRQKPPWILFALLLISIVVIAVQRFVLSLNAQGSILALSWKKELEMELEGKIDWAPLQALTRLAPNKSIIVTGVNCGFLDFADNWIESLKRNNINNFGLVPLDDTAYEELRRVHPEHVLPPFYGFTNKAEKMEKQHDLKNVGSYGSVEFGTIVQSRPLFLLCLLEAGFTVFYSDLDTVWKANALDEFTPGEYDFIAPSDSSIRLPPDSTNSNNLCTGLLYLEPTNSTIKLMKLWYHNIISSGSRTNQKPFNDAVRQLGSEIRWKVADQDAFPPGYMYFRDSKWVYQHLWKPTREPVIIHNNHIVGKENKLQRFKENDLWHPSGKLQACTA